MILLNPSYTVEHDFIWFFLWFFFSLFSNPRETPRGYIFWFPRGFPGIVSPFFTNLLKFLYLNQLRLPLFPCPAPLPLLLRLRVDWPLPFIYLYIRCRSYDGPFTIFVCGPFFFYLTHLSFYTPDTSRVFPWQDRS